MPVTLRTVFIPIRRDISRRSSTTAEKLEVDLYLSLSDCPDEIDADSRHNDRDRGLETDRLQSREARKISVLCVSHKVVPLLSKHSHAKCVTSDQQQYNNKTGMFGGTITRGNRRARDRRLVSKL